MELKDFPDAFFKARTFGVVEDLSRQLREVIEDLKKPKEPYRPNKRCGLCDTEALHPDDECCRECFYTVFLRIPTMTCVCDYENGKVTGLCGAHSEAFRIYQKPLDEKVEAAEAEIVRLREIVFKQGTDIMILGG